MQNNHNNIIDNSRIHHSSRVDLPPHLWSNFTNNNYYYIHGWASFKQKSNNLGRISNNTTAWVLRAPTSSSLWNGFFFLFFFTLINRPYSFSSINVGESRRKKTSVDQLRFYIYYYNLFRVRFVSKVCL